MAWNEPNGNDKDPWGGSGKKETPPDLDEMFKKLQRKLNGLVKSGGQGGEPEQAAPSFVPTLLFTLLFILVIWFVSGFYAVKQAEQGVVLRFGEYSKTVGPGLHWYPRFVDTVTKVDVQKINNYDYSDRMFTKDENIIEIAVSVQYQVDDAKDFLYNVVTPIHSLQQATASALRQVVGSENLNRIMTTERENVRREVEIQLKEILQPYNTGLAITNVSLQPAKAPEQVKAAFDDVTKSREDKERYIKQAEAYYNQEVLKANGQARRLDQSAKAYKEQVELNAKGDVARFLAVLPLYKQAPEVTRERLYLETIEGVLDSSTKVFVDTGDSSNLMYLPIDKLLSQVPPRRVEDLPDGAADDLSVTEPPANAAPIEPSRGRYSSNNSSYRFLPRGQR